MRILILLFAAALLGAAATGLVVSQRAAEKRARELAVSRARWEAERAALEARLADLGATSLPRAVRPDVTEAKAPAGPAPVFPAAPVEPAAIVERLARLHPAPGADHGRTLRRVVHELERLVDAGPAAVEAIEKFLTRDEDVDYRQARESDRSPRSGADSISFSELVPRPPAAPVTDFTLPPTLRMGLLDVLRQIGGDTAERVLAATLTRTTHGMELAYLTRVLDEATPGKHKEFALASARALLTDPPTVGESGEANDADEDGPYYVLHHFRDPVFAGTARERLRDEKGRVDRRALNYLMSVEHERAVSAVTTAWSKAPTPTPEVRVTLVGAILPYVGREPEAGRLFREFLRQEDLPLPLRLAALSALARTASTVSATNPDPRFEFLAGLSAQAPDPALIRGIRLALEQLGSRFSGTPALEEAEFVRRAQDTAPAPNGTGGAKNP